MIGRWVQLVCNSEGCPENFWWRTHDATVARREARAEGWVVSRIGTAGVFTDWCPKHATGMGTHSRYSKKG